MAIQFSTTFRDNAIGQFESTVGTAPTLEIRSGSPPADCAAADSGTVLATMVLPSDWLGAASSGAVSKSGTWQDLTADATGTAGHFRIKQGATCHMQGTVGTSGTDMIIDNTSINSGQQVTVNSFTMTMGGA